MQSFVYSPGIHINLKNQLKKEKSKVKVYRALDYMHKKRVKDIRHLSCKVKVPLWSHISSQIHAYWLIYQRGKKGKPKRKRSNTTKTHDNLFHLQYLIIVNLKGLAARFKLPHAQATSRYTNDLEKFVMSHNKFPMFTCQDILHFNLFILINMIYKKGLSHDLFTCHYYCNNKVLLSPNNSSFFLS